MRSGESGAGALVAVAVIGALLLLTGALVPLLGAVVLESRARGAADAGALAAAESLSGRSAGDPCERAVDLVARNGAVVTACTLNGADAVVDVAIDAGWITVGASARAGPPRDDGGTSASGTAIAWRSRVLIMARMVSRPIGGGMLSRGSPA